ncbi:hypothetical protein HYN69_13225 [Gemmobacter aquarius]|uniref:GAF domain-containing protein n=1 Tax=Paragemmobacter aquarius TaxID=2169400 RepID=A0A2S0URG7_9RHOB|nr:hypothetical protein HYN69_13225 [Gemmobacter aquarius]
MFAFRCDDVDALLHRAAELVSEALDLPLVKLLEHHPEQGEMLIRAGVNWQPGVVGHETFGDDERSPGGHALRSDKPVVSPDIDLEDRFDIPDVLRRHGCGAWSTLSSSAKTHPSACWKWMNENHEISMRMTLRSCRPMRICAPQRLKGFEAI